MKLILSLACLLAALSGFAQTQDTTTHKTVGIEQGKSARSVTELFAIGEKTYQNSQEDYTPFKGHTRGFHVGFMNFANLPSACDAMKLDGAGSFTLQFNLFNHNISLSKRNNIGITTGLGLEYQRFRFNNENFTLIKNEGTTEIVEIIDLYDNVEKVTRSSFKNLYLTIPVIFEVQFPASKTFDRRMYVSGGFMGGVRMHTKTKVLYQDSNDDKTKEKYKGNLNVNPFKVDAIVRIGYNRINVWGGYTLTNLFKKEGMPGLNVYTIGFGLSI